MPMLNSLRQLIERVPGRLEKLSNEKIESKSTPSSWPTPPRLPSISPTCASTAESVYGRS